MKRYTIPLQETLKPIWQKFIKNKPKIAGEFADKKDTFKINLKDNLYIAGCDYYDTKSESKSFGGKIIKPPHRKWYKLILQYLTFGRYKAPWECKIKLL